LVLSRETKQAPKLFSVETLENFTSLYEPKSEGIFLTLTEEGLKALGK